MPPAKTRLQISIDADLARLMDEIWRNAVDEANKKGRSLPSFSSFWNRRLRELLQKATVK